MKVPKRAISKIIGLLTIVFVSLGVTADEFESYFAVEYGQIANKFTDVFEGPSLRASVGFKLNRNFGLEVAYEFSPGGTVTDNFWDFDSTGTRYFDDINTLSVFGTAEWDANPRFSFFTKFGVARGTVDYTISDAIYRPTSGSLTETNVVLILGVAVPTNSAYDLTFSVKENFSANFFGLGDSFDSSTVCVGFRRRW
ncbi:MAG: porin family protein [Gammaproteobacteria bacterium]|nr:porin family protein [Gammaproteobacteria bacterium]MYI76822.1 porin family protein [Gammaproteobacteria bacterium]